jgi:hypothetical protein
MTEANGSPTPDIRPPAPVARTKTYPIVAIASLGLLAGLSAIGLYHLDVQTKATLLSQHGPAVIGTPFAILVATILVSGARAVDGEFGGSLLGVELKGAAATLLAWLSVFFAVILAIRTLW